MLNHQQDDGGAFALVRDGASSSTPTTATSAIAAAEQQRTVPTELLPQSPMTCVELQTAQPVKIAPLSRNSSNSQLPGAKIRSIFPPTSRYAAFESYSPHQQRRQTVSGCLSRLEARMNIT
ncbi:hypothetical protein NL676_036904 [Syzygium grande]|nr:hypothetical protein NL676_036904 [Syzygium grande]